MTTPRIGGLCFGYGGLDMAVQSVIGGDLAWYAEFDKGASKIGAHRFPGVPNHGDMTAIDWAAVEPVDVLTGGTPCQDLSHAGKRAGMTEGTRSNLWVAMREAIATIRPRLVVWENVAGAYSATADSDLERREGLLGDRSGRPALRALGRVLGDLASLGYDASWHGLRAADVGAPHGRLRVFVVAWPAADAERRQLSWQPMEQFGPVVAAGSRRVDSCRATLLPSPRTSDTNGAGRHGEGGLDLRTAVSLLPTPRCGDGDKGGPNQRGSSGDLMLPSAVVQLLPTPAVNDMGKAYTPEEWDAWCAKQQAAHGNGNGHGKSLEIEAQRLLPTTSVADVTGGRKSRSGDRSGELLLNGIAAENAWGDYAAAIHRWESLTRPAPAPTEQNWDQWRKRKASRLANRLPVGMRGSIRFMVDGPPARLSPRFSEWMMGLPEGWVADVPGITRNEALKALGNGVVPQQAAHALRLMLGGAEAVAA